MIRDLRALALSSLAATIAADGRCFADPATPPMPTVMTKSGQVVPAPANCVPVCAPSKDMLKPGSFVVNDLNAMECITQPLYDILAYPAVGQLAFSFFQVPVSGTKTRASTNMQLAGQLPAPQKFLCSGISIEFLSGLPPVAGPQADTGISNINDYYAVMSNLAGVNGWLHFEIGSKGYLDVAPLMQLPARSHINGAMAAATNLTTGAATQTLGSFGFNDGDVFKPVPLLLEAGQNFSVTVNFPALVALPSSNTHSQLACYLSGSLYRSPQ